MRITLAVAVACLVFGGIAAADNATAAVRKTTEIPAQGLGPALMSLAKEFDFQVLYRTEVVGTLRTQGVSGAMTAAEALEHVLSGTGLTYRYLDDKTLMIMPVGAASGGGHDAAQSEDTGKESQSQGGDQKKSFWTRFRLAQATPSSNSGLSPQPSALSPQLAQSQVPTGQEQPSKIEEIVVTATRREEPLSRVPISVMAFTQDQMDSQGVRQLSDLVRLTPGLNLTTSSVDGDNTIAIRGISSHAGSGTTGIYIDDTPIQVNNVGYGAATTFPGLFDIERVEVLRGPQGTLFGSSSEGGTIRFVQAQPGLQNFSSYTRAEVGNTEQGDLSYEAGGAFGGPIIEDKLGFRVSAFYRRDGGFIDAVNGTYKILDPTGAAYGNSVAFTPTQTVEKDLNWDRTVAVRGALTWAATDSVTVTPSVFYQRRHVNDGPGATYWLSQSDVGSHNYTRPYYFAGNPATDPALTSINVPNNQFGDDSFTLSAVRVDWDLGPVQLISNTSFFHRDSVQWYDYTQGYLSFYEAAQFPAHANYPPAGWKGMSDYLHGQRNFVQEIRLQSTDAQSRVSWTAGMFFAHDKESAEQSISLNYLAKAPYVGFSPDFAGYTNGPPYGPGSSAYENFLGAPLWPNSTTFYANWQETTKQIAAFGQADLKLISKLTLTAGLRVSRSTLDYNAIFAAPDNNSNAPYGFPCIPNTYCAGPSDSIAPGAYAVGTGPFTPSYPTSTAHSSETATTPKVGLEFQVTDTNMLYASATKGYRPAGASLKVPTVCGSDLQTFGYEDAQGHSTQPLVFGSDHVWSYELGSKNRLFDNRLVLDGSVYLIKWKNIQTEVSLPNCGYAFVDNLADATSKGFDLGFQARPFAPLILSGAIGYNKPTFDGNSLSPSGAVTIFTKGAAIPDSGPPWTTSLSGEYAFDLFGGRNFYLRTDYTHTSEWRRAGTEVPGTPGFDRLLRPDPAYAVVNSRLGVRLHGLDVSLFVNNLTDAAPLLSLSHNSNYSHNPQDWTANAIRPRSYGITFTYRQ